MSRTLGPLLLALGAPAAAARHDYPSGPAPVAPPEHLVPGALGGAPCPECPWDRGDLGPYPPPFNAPDFNPVHRGRYFDVYGHWISTRYSEVFWTAQPAVPLPDDIVSEFKGRPISITGFEVDVVAGGENNETEWSIPEFQVYNHHYCATITGADAKMIKVGSRGQDSLLRDDADASGNTTRGRSARRAFEVHPPEWEPRDLPSATPQTSTIPTAQNFWQGNGGEHRKSFKHLPLGTGQLIMSPEQFILQPMLINTNYPASPGQTPREAFHDAPLPKEALSPAGANYSGLMECPCTTRTKKIITGFETRVTGTCGADGDVQTASECFEAAAQLMKNIANNITDNDASRPRGCYFIASQNGTNAHFNSPPASSNPVNCGQRATGAKVHSMGGADSTTGLFHVHLDLDGSTGNATITLVGPPGRWFGIGFNASAMSDLPYTITVEGDKVTERKLGNHMPGSPLKASVEVLSNMLVPACHAWTYLPLRFTTPYNIADGTCRLRASGAEGFTTDGWMDGMFSGVIDRDSDKSKIRTVVLRRPLVGLTEDHFTFDPSAASFRFIDAVGTTPTFQYHGKSRGGGSIIMVEEGAPVCVCRGKTQGGSINGIPWSNNCHAYPDTTILRDHNPSCSIESYGGGMICCHHGIFLLDQDQTVPPPIFRFRMKFRFYYEDPANTTVQKGVGASLYPGLDYQNAFFMFRETEIAHGEYDVPKCSAGTKPEDCVHTVVGHFQIKDAMHDMEMINADTNETLCYTEPAYGMSDQATNESGYASGIPPCLWGSEAEGLPAPPVVSLDTNITVIKKANSTVKHYGVMGHWQMRGIWAKGPSNSQN
eukprot:g3171.t1